MGNFWENIPVECRGQAFNALYDYQMLHYGTKLDEPEGLRGEPKRKPDIVNAPDYLEEEEIKIAKEMSLIPHRPRRVE